MIEIKKLTAAEVERLSSEFQNDIWALFRLLQDQIISDIIPKIESGDGLTPEELIKEIEAYFL